MPSTRFLVSGRSSLSCCLRRAGRRARHHGPPPPVGPVAGTSREATHIGSVTYEDDFLEARLVFQALPTGVPGAGGAARERCCTTCSSRWSRSSPRPSARGRASSRTTTSTIASSIRSATRSACSSRRSCGASRRAMTPTEKALLAGARPSWSSRCSRRAAPTAQVALALATMATIEGTPEAREWPDRLERAGALERRGGRGAPTATCGASAGALETLAAVLADSPRAGTSRLDACT